VHAEDLLVDAGGDGETVEQVRKGTPEFDIVSTLTFIVKPIDSIDGGTLMVPTEEEEVLGVLDLVGEEETDGLQRLLASVHIVPEKQIVGIRWETTIFKET
jgi:hypothetical protein